MITKSLILERVEEGKGRNEIMERELKLLKLLAWSGVTGSAGENVLMQTVFLARTAMCAARRCLHQSSQCHALRACSSLSLSRGERYMLSLPIGKI